MTARIIKDESPLARLPAGLPAAQRGWLDGLRYSVDIADLAMLRLGSSLQHLGTGAQEPASPIPSDVYAMAVSDAWTFLDAVWRLKRFFVDGRFPRAPGEPQPSQSSTKLNTERFRELVRSIKPVRDGFQHLDNFAARLAERGRPVWGVLNWSILHDDARGAEMCLLVPGTFIGGTTEFPFVNPLGRSFQAVVDHITLSAFECSVDLSEVHRCIASLIHDLEGILIPQIEGFPQAGSTSLIRLSCAFSCEKPTQEHE